MEPVLGGRANVNPPLIINRSTEFASESENGSETPRESQRDEASNQGTPVVDDDDGDPFLIGASHRAKKRRRRNRDPNEGVREMLEVFEKKWEKDSTAETLVREEERQQKGEVVGIMKENQQIMKQNQQIMQQTMNNAVDVLRMIAEKM
jgi:hypothetical protein